MKRFVAVLAGVVAAVVIATIIAGVDAAIITMLANAAIELPSAVPGIIAVLDIALKIILPIWGGIRAYKYVRNRNAITPLA